MVTKYIKLSLSIKQEDEEDYNRFVDYVKKDPRFKVLKKDGDKDIKEFIGISSVFSKFWKGYLKKQEENESKEKSVI